MSYLQDLELDNAALMNKVSILEAELSLYHALDEEEVEQDPLEDMHKLAKRYDSPLVMLYMDGILLTVSPPNLIADDNKVRDPINLKRLFDGAAAAYGYTRGMLQPLAQALHTGYLPAAPKDDPKTPNPEGPKGH